MTLAHRIYINPAITTDGLNKVTKRGPQYDVFYNGELICSSHQPLFDSARVLRGRGLTGPLEMWDHERPFPRMRSSIEKAAQATIVERHSTDIRIGMWKPPDDVLRGLNVERRNGAAGPSGISNHEKASDGVTAKAQEQISHSGCSAE